MADGAGPGGGALRAERADAGAPPTARATTLTPYPDGPVVLRGPFHLVDETGTTVPTHRRAVALCRCGRSRLGAFCDGTHRSAGFRATGGPRRETSRTVVVPLPTEPG